MSEVGVHTKNADYAARGMAQEAIQAMRSHEAVDHLRFENMENKFEDIKELISNTNKKIDNIAKSYDNKFWTLAITIIFALVSGIATLVYHMLTK